MITNSKLIRVILFVLIITSPRLRCTKDIQISIGQSKISSFSTCKSLGVMLDNNFAIDAHISNVCRSTNIWNIRAIRDLLTPASAAQLLHSLVTS